MKTLHFFRDFDFATSKHSMRAFKGGRTYDLQPEAAVEAAVAVGAAMVVKPVSEVAPAPVSAPAVTAAPKARRRARK